MKKLTILLITFLAGTWLGAWGIYRALVGYFYVVEELNSDVYTDPPTNSAERMGLVASVIARDVTFARR